MKKSVKKLIYLLVVTMFVLTACGKDTIKTEKKAKEQEEQFNVDDEESLDDKSDEEETTPEDSESDEEMTAPGNEQTEEGVSEENTSDKTSENVSGEQNTDKAENNVTTESDSQQKPTSGSTTTTTPSKNPVKTISEETKTAEVAFKYGVTKYDIVTKNYMLYSDGSKELIRSTTDTYYNNANYSATNDQLKAESNSNASTYLSYYQEVLRLVNEICAEAGVAPLTLDTTLCQAASMRALEMDYSGVFDHIRPSGEDCWTVLSYYNVSYYTCGENIAAGQTSPAMVVNAWKNSPGHYKNMIDASFTRLGVGYSGVGVGAYGHYWCQLFAG